MRRIDTVGLSVLASWNVTTLHGVGLELGDP